MAEARPRHPGRCNDWCRDHGCGNTTRFWNAQATAEPLTEHTFTDALRNIYIDPPEVRPRTAGAFAEAFRQEMEGAQEQMERDLRREAELLMRTTENYGPVRNADFVGNEVRIPVRRNRGATAHMWAGDTLPPAETNYAEYRWLPDQDLYITPEGERITGLQMRQLLEG